jgi:hypothetical protein
MTDDDSSSEEDYRQRFVDSFDIKVETRRDHALERVLHTVCMKLTFAHEYSEHIIANTLFVEALSKMVQSAAEQLFEMGVCVHEQAEDFFLPTTTTTTTPTKPVSP